MLRTHYYRGTTHAGGSVAKSEGRSFSIMPGVNGSLVGTQGEYGDIWGSEAFPYFDLSPWFRWEASHENTKRMSGGEGIAPPLQSPRPRMTNDSIRIRKQQEQVAIIARYLRSDESILLDEPGWYGIWSGGYPMRLILTEQRLLFMPVIRGEMERGKEIENYKYRDIMGVEHGTGFNSSSIKLNVRASSGIERVIGFTLMNSLKEKDVKELIEAQLRKNPKSGI